MLLEHVHGPKAKAKGATESCNGQQLGRRRAVTLDFWQTVIFIEEDEMCTPQDDLSIGFFAEREKKPEIFKINLSAVAVSDSGTQVVSPRGWLLFRHNLSP